MNMKLDEIRRAVEILGETLGKGLKESAELFAKSRIQNLAAKNAELVFVNGDAKKTQNEAKGIKQNMASLERQLLTPRPPEEGVAQQEAPTP